MSAKAAETDSAPSDQQAVRQMQMLRGGLVVLGLLGILAMPSGMLISKAVAAAGVDAVLTPEQLQDPEHRTIVMRAHQNAQQVLVRATALGGAVVALLAFGTLYLASRDRSETGCSDNRHVTCSSTESST
ncbi:hypothetical protein Mal4_49700 [Maioricimonas rarisocia]|uniref:Uncharacterized protein n=1 Tax=Maioricimonas rarisocia TaxID=2528026 RepID=A0A517ZDP8_9PLAN|nr:hypothetical protein [Maioricimonas rarisocia]QDU40612.1 hypothetical protein Mal4_49700 [Maioricimonas rarisocia]